MGLLNSILGTMMGTGGASSPMVKALMMLLATKA